jgi:uncharacterized protein YegP (UPF0339 family)
MGNPADRTGGVTEPGGSGRRASGYSEAHVGYTTWGTFGSRFPSPSSAQPHTWCDLSSGTAPADTQADVATFGNPAHCANMTAPLGPEKGVRMAGKFELCSDAAGKFRFRLKAGNGEIIAVSSEGYESKSGAENGIESVRTNAPSAPVDDQT